MESRKRHSRHKDKLSAYSIKYARSHKIRRTVINERYRCKKAGAIGDVSYLDWKNALIAQKYRCAICKKQTKLEMDHIKPIVLGGAHLPDNIQALCRLCNTRKGYSNGN